jgi:hypothetical protein
VAEVTQPATFSLHTLTGLFLCGALSVVNLVFFDIVFSSCGVFLNMLSSKVKKNVSLALVAHAHNPSYSGGRDQEDHGSKPAQANSS